MKGSKRRSQKMPVGRSARITADERLKIATAALYLAPRYTNKKGEWRMMSSAKFAELKRLLGSERSVEALTKIFRDWLRDEANKPMWEQMQADAKANWDYYFKFWIEEEKKGPDAQQPRPPHVHAQDGRWGKEQADDGDDHERHEEAEYDMEFDTSDAAEQAQLQIFPQIHYHGPIINFNTPVYVNITAQKPPGEQTDGETTPDGH